MTDTSLYEMKNPRSRQKKCKGSLSVTDTSLYEMKNRRLCLRGYDRWTLDAQNATLRWYAALMARQERRAKDTAPNAS